jgi:hypothetical protein
MQNPLIEEKRMLKKLGQLVRIIVLCAFFLAVAYLFINMYESNCQELLIETNQELAALDSMTPERYYQEKREKIIEQRGDLEKILNNSLFKK